MEGRAYALGLGIRGRTAIRTVDETLWQAIKKCGYESEKFDLHLTKQISFRLRDAPTKAKKTFKDDDDSSQLEPSVLLYQSEMCSAFLNEIERLYGGRLVENNIVNLNFNATVLDVDFDNRTILFLTENGASQNAGPFDLLVGCDGVNSKVRKSMAASFPYFQSETKLLPGEVKVARLPIMPPKLDPSSIHLIVGSGGCSAFVEPTANGRCCVLFARRGTTSGSTTDSKDRNSNISTTLDDLFLSISSNTNIDLIAQDISQRFPLLEGLNFTDIAMQLVNQRSSSTSSVKCNVYHAGNFAVLVGDAAHATGGVSGQGCNSALVDSAVLADQLEESFRSTTTTNNNNNSCTNKEGVLADQLEESFRSTTTTNNNNNSCTNKKHKIQNALLKYSQKQVPEGLALYDLAFGQPSDKNGWKSIWISLNSLLDTIFGGKFGIGRPPLQTLLTTSVAPFSDIRRNRQDLYTEPFPDEGYFNTVIESLSRKD
eukprot:CAMPEP_0172434986 /NCGR_PEP_ID=MMETSP1064-20121228/70930_1 /TAXON_ID=202472 /ORGANISM="Aulacoseira subarctica , Strain CCAP 1002/5" /LENGTH=484 /DNA_ID=CAMNT_0013183253 /DNA_START=286 /DNA_END=1741 /DNA_ORIENTATION=+